MGPADYIYYSPEINSARVSSPWRDIGERVKVIRLQDES